MYMIIYVHYGASINTPTVKGIHDPCMYVYIHVCMCACK